MFDIIFSKNLVENGFHAPSVMMRLWSQATLLCLKSHLYSFLLLRHPSILFILGVLEFHSIFMCSLFLVFVLVTQHLMDSFNLVTQSLFSPAKFKNFFFAYFPSIFLWSFSRTVLNICPKVFACTFMCWSFILHQSKENSSILPCWGKKKCFFACE